MIGRWSVLVVPVGQEVRGVHSHLCPLHPERSTQHRQSTQNTLYTHYTNCYDSSKVMKKDRKKERKEERIKLTLSPLSPMVPFGPYTTRNNKEALLNETLLHMIRNTKTNRWKWVFTWGPGKPSNPGLPSRPSDPSLPFCPCMPGRPALPCTQMTAFRSLQHNVTSTFKFTPTWC